MVVVDPHPAPVRAASSRLSAFTLVVPVFEERDRLEDTAAELCRFVAGTPGSELVFVDDGSSDGTPELVEAVVGRHPDVDVRLLRRPHRGKGAAVAAGLRDARAPYAAFCDVDLSTSLDALRSVLWTAMQAPVLAIGSRDLAGSELVQAESPARELLGRAYNRLLQATIAPGVVDTQCGAKASARSVWAAILPLCREEGFAWDAEAIAVARALGIEVRQVPVQWSHDERSKVRVGRDGIAMVLATPRIWRRARAAQQSRRTAVAIASTPVPTGGATSSGLGTGGVFDADQAAALAAADSDHWWFRSKAAFVTTALRRTRGRGRGGDHQGWLVDAGAGSGGVSAMLGWDPQRTVVVEGNGALVAAATRRGLPGLQGSVDALPLTDGSAAVVSLLDVIEHLPDPRRALDEARRVLTPGGRLVVNVPAHAWLWSAADVALGHVRRYNRPALREELAAAGFEPVLLTHVFSWLVAPVWATRRRSQSPEAALGLERTSSLIDLAALALTAAERSLVGRVSIPAGTSVLCVAVRSEAA